MATDAVQQGLLCVFGSGVFVFSCFGYSIVLCCCSLSLSFVVFPTPLASTQLKKKVCDFFWGGDSARA